jgi:hypothetical protein
MEWLLSAPRPTVKVPSLGISRRLCGLSLVFIEIGALSLLPREEGRAPSTPDCGRDCCQLVCNQEVVRDEADNEKDLVNLTCLPSPGPFRPRRLLTLT